MFIIILKPQEIIILSPFFITGWCMYLGKFGNIMEIDRAIMYFLQGH